MQEQHRRSLEPAEHELAASPEPGDPLSDETCRKVERQREADVEPSLLDGREGAAGQPGAQGPHHRLDLGQLRHRPLPLPPLACWPGAAPL